MSGRAARDWYRGFFDAAYVEVLAHQWSPAQTRAQVDFVWRACGLAPGMRVLDVGCGFGRHAAALAARGAEVVGIDLSPAMLAEARRRHGRRARLAFRRADMRRLPFHGEFDAVVSLFTSFGYFDHAGNRATLRGMVRALRPGGRLLVDTASAAHLRRHAKPQRWRRLGPDCFVLEAPVFDPRADVVTNTWWILQPRRGRAVRRTFRVQAYDLAAWKRMLVTAGAPLVRACGGYDAALRPAAGRSRLVVLGRRA